MKKFKIVLIILFFLGILGTVAYYEGSLPVNKTDRSAKIFVVERGSSVNEIINKLANEHLIRNRIVFLMIVKQLGIENSLQAGDFRLSPSMSSKEIAENLTKGTLDIWVTIIEGLRKEEIAQILAKDFNIPENEFIKQTEEGILYPDTYLIPRQASLQDITNIFYRNFNKKYTPELKKKAQDKGLSDNDVITLASLVEREANSKNNKQIVASILYKRLKNGWPLQVDATVQYLLGYQLNEKTWWKKNLTKKDLAIKSPYNTYQNIGLPPKPISNPGIDAIEAVVNADVTIPYWYYISNKDGSAMIYSKTLEEHNQNISKHLK